MKDFQEQLITLIKGLMQPMFSVLAAFIVVRLLMTGFDQGQLFWLAAAVVGFWFGKTVGLFGNGKAPESIADTNKDLIAIVKGQQNVINNQSIDLGASVPVAAVQTPVAAPAAASPPAAAAPADNDNPDTVLAQLAADLDKEAANG